jgi:hypothetical protein
LDQGQLAARLNGVRAARRLYETFTARAARIRFAGGQGLRSTALHSDRETVAKWRMRCGFVYKIAPRSTIARETEDRCSLYVYFQPVIVLDGDGWSLFRSPANAPGEPPHPNGKRAGSVSTNIRGNCRFWMRFCTKIGDDHTNRKPHRCSVIPIGVIPHGNINLAGDLTCQIIAK